MLRNLAIIAKKLHLLQLTVDANKLVADKQVWHKPLFGAIFKRSALICAHLPVIFNSTGGTYGQSRTKEDLRIRLCCQGY
jgi:hypothetical protein